MTALRRTIRKIQMLAYPDPSLSPSLDAYGHNYPWQLYTRLRGVQLTTRLKGSFPVDKLREELAAVLAEYAPKQQFGQYHAGGWTAVALHAIDGNPEEDQDKPDANFDKTPALKLAPTMEAIMDSFPAEKRRVRLLKLAPGKKIFWHRDFWHSIDSTQVRLHIPIFTNPKVGFQISHEDCRWQPGELWYGDFSFPHRLLNGGQESRVHLVIDLITNKELRELMPDKLLAQRELRDTARRHCNWLLEAWAQLFATENRLAMKREARAE